MEKLIGVQHSERNLRETLIEIQPDVNKPKYQIIDEEDQFTPEVTTSAMKCAAQTMNHISNMGDCVY
jgi:hypothetical protein